MDILVLKLQQGVKFWKSAFTYVIIIPTGKLISVQYVDIIFWNYSYCQTNTNQQIWILL